MPNPGQMCGVCVEEIKTEQVSSPEGLGFNKSVSIIVSRGAESKQDRFLGAVRFIRLLGFTDRERAFSYSLFAPPLNLNPDDAS